MPRLIHLNGPPAVGKSTVAAALVQQRPLALNLDIDRIRVSLGGWQEHEESKTVARGLGFRLAEWHLAAGFDVVLPQLVVVPTVVKDLEELASRAGAELYELVLTASVATCLERAASAHEQHPREHLAPNSLAAHIEESLSALRRLPGARMVAAEGDAASVIARVEAVLGERSP